MALKGNNLALPLALLVNFLTLVIEIFQRINIFKGVLQIAVKYYPKIRM